MHIPSHKHTPTDTHTQSQTARNTTTHHHDSHGPYLQHSLYIRLQLQSVLQLIYPKQGRLGSNSDDADDDVEQDSDAGSKWFPQQRNPLSVTEISASFVVYNKWLTIQLAGEGTGSTRPYSISSITRYKVAICINTWTWTINKPNSYLPEKLLAPRH